MYLLMLFVYGLLCLVCGVLIRILIRMMQPDAFCSADEETVPEAEFTEEHNAMEE